jgi:hypothetical protein
MTAQRLTSADQATDARLIIRKLRLNRSGMFA